MSKIVGIGNPLMDLIMHTDYSALQELEARAGTMNLVDEERMSRVVLVGGIPKRTAGGSCANTLRGIAWLRQDDENKPLFMGAVSKDEEGLHFERILNQLGVDAALAWKETATGKSAIIVTPDYERTMFTYLGANREFTSDDIDWNRFKSADYFYTTGFMWDTDNQKEATMRAMEECLLRGMEVFFDLADIFVVERSGVELREWLPGRVDILFANRDELSAMTGEKEDAAILEGSRDLGRIVVMKKGAQGCSVTAHGKVIDIPGEKVVPHDTTAAGDSFAAGFVHGYTEGYPLEVCGRLANKLAAGIVTAEGCSYDCLDREELMSVLG